MTIVVFLYVIIAIALVNTLSIEFIFSSAPTLCVCGWSPSRLFPQMGNITLATRVKQKNLRNISRKVFFASSQVEVNGSNNKHHLTPSGRREQQLKNNPERLGPIQVRSISRQQNTKDSLLIDQSILPEEDKAQEDREPQKEKTHTKLNRTNFYRATLEQPKKEPVST